MNNPTQKEVTAAVRAILERVISGGDTTKEELESFPVGRELFSDLAATAWHQLYHWMADSDIRVRDPEYAAHLRRDLATLLVELDAL